MLYCFYSNSLLTPTPMANAQSILKYLKKKMFVLNKQYGYVFSKQTLMERVSEVVPGGNGNSTNRFVSILL